jgi:hypothetical protein
MAHLYQLFPVPIQSRAITGPARDATLRFDKLTVGPHDLLSMIAPAMAAGIQIIIGAGGDLI